jgi:aquaporin Z
MYWSNHRDGDSPRHCHRESRLLYCDKRSRTEWYGALSPHQYSLGACFLAELVLSFLFLIVIFGSTHANAPKGFAGIAIGLTLVLIHIVGIPITGTSVNPARSLGPALLAGGEAIAQLWLFIVAPILGGILAALLWRSVFDKTASPNN